MGSGNIVRVAVNFLSAGEEKAKKPNAVNAAITGAPILVFV